MDFEEYYKKNVGEFDDRLSKLLDESEDEKQMRRLLKHSVEGGKRFRSTLTLMVSDMFSGNRENALTKAAIVELIHNASLVHDDVVDMDEMRRGMPTLWKLIDKIPFYGPDELNSKNLAILTGDGMFSKAMKLIENPDVLRVTADAIEALTSGAVKEAKGQLKGKLFGSSVENYIETIKAKTASLFALATHLGAKSASIGGDMEENARKTGTYIGILYQLADDLAEDDLTLSREKTEELVEEYCDKFNEITTGLPGNQPDEESNEMPSNEYREALIDVPVFMFNKMMKQEDADYRLSRHDTSGYSLKKDED